MTRTNFEKNTQVFAPKFMRIGEFSKYLLFKTLNYIYWRVYIDFACKHMMLHIDSAKVVFFTIRYIYKLCV